MAHFLSQYQAEVATYGIKLQGYAHLIARKREIQTLQVTAHMTECSAK